MRPAPVEFLSEQYSRIEESLNAFGFHLVPSERTGHTASKFCFSRVQSGRDCGDLDEFSDHLEEVPFQELLSFDCLFRKEQPKDSYRYSYLLDIRVCLNFHSVEAEGIPEDLKGYEWDISFMVSLDPGQVIDQQMEHGPEFTECDSRRLYELSKALHLAGDFKITAGSVADECCEFGAGNYDRVIRFSKSGSSLLNIPYEEMRALRQEDLDYHPYFPNPEYGWQKETGEVVDIVVRKDEWDPSLNYKIPVKEV